MTHAILSESELQNAELMTFKIIQARHILTTMSSGDIYLGCADYYAYQEVKTGNKGQGDINEGLFARVKKDNVKFIKEQEELHGADLENILNGDFVDLKLKSVINMPVYCFYTINASDPSVNYFDEPGESPKVIYRTYEFIVPEKVLLDFSSGNFGILKFLNHTDLFSRIKCSLKAEGCENVAKTRVKYVDRENKEWICGEEHPAELFYKDTSFSHQKEGRLVITDEHFSFINKARELKYRPLNIGDMSGIVEKEEIKVQNIRFKIHRMRLEEV